MATIGIGPPTVSGVQQVVPIVSAGVFISKPDPEVGSERDV